MGHLDTFEKLDKELFNFIFEIYIFQSRLCLFKIY